MIKLGTPTCNYTVGEYLDSQLTNVILDNSVNKGILTTWLTKTPMSVAKRGHSSFVIENTVYICGGISSVAYSSSVEAYDTLTDTWSTKANLPQNISHAQSESYGGKGYLAFGTTDGSDYLNSILEYNPNLNTWTAKTASSNGRYAPFSFLKEGKIYFGGGEITGGGITSSVVCYDIITDSWSNKTSMPTATRNSNGITCGNFGYVVCGVNFNNNTNSVQEYNFLTDTWSTKAPYPFSCSSGFLESFDGLIYAGAGSTFNNESFLSNFYVYSPILNTWTAKNSLQTARDNCSSAFVKDTIYVFGGKNASTVYDKNEAIQIVTSDIYYTTDGTDPVTIVESPVYSETVGATAIKYTEPFDLPLPAILKARAYPTN